MQTQLWLIFSLILQVIMLAHPSFQSVLHVRKLVSFIIYLNLNGGNDMQNFFISLILYTYRLTFVIFNFQMAQLQEMDLQNQVECAKKKTPLGSASPQGSAGCASSLQTNMKGVT